MNENEKEIAWRNVDFCVHCDVCRIAFRFVNPNAEALVFIKKMVAVGRPDILLTGYKNDENNGN